MAKTMLAEHSPVWENLREAIAASSGFKRWQATKEEDKQFKGNDTLDFLVRRYLRETLETLAY